MSRKIFDQAAIFPLQPGTKKPLPGTKGFYDARCNATIPPGYNIGCRPSSVGLVCIDLDAGYDEAWAAEHLPPTFTVKSPHGRHLYYRCDERFSNSDSNLGKHINVRSAGGYTVLPPSRLADGGTYEWLDEREPAALPEQVQGLLRAKRDYDNRAYDPDTDNGDDNPSKLSQARTLLKNTDPHDDGYKIACRLRRDLGLSHAAAIEVFAEWSDTLDWPWDHEKIWSVCRNASRYGNGATGLFATDGNPGKYAQPIKWHDNSARAWLRRELTPTIPLIGPINTTSRVMLVAPTGLGKTHVAMAIAVAVAAGVSWLHWNCSKPHKALYIDGEMPRALLKERLIEALERIGIPDAALDNLVLVSTADNPDHTPLNQNSTWINELIALYGPDLVIFDNVQALTVGDQKDTEAWRTMLPWMRSLTDNGKAQLWIHHANELGGMYGDKTRAYQLDTVIELERADALTDIAFNLKFTKHRELHPKRNKDAYRTGLIVLDDGRWQFTEEVQVQRSGMETALEGEYGSGITTAELVKRLIDHGDLRSPGNIKKWINRNRRRPEINRYTVPGVSPVRWRLPPYGVPEIVPEVSQNVPKQPGTLGHPL